MSKAYSNKALPAGTVLREWRLEEVLGVGGFGIVYKGRGIYFNELVAIKEYFPSSISERDAEDTVVPIDSDAEEVHALGLKKFVEEAKLLWNLSTPSRHPNIVSVRSLFEIHGTAYMVMDFEDGVSLSRLLKQGRKFNERTLWNIVRPVAEGLDRAHRVGVLHRDIKPPNILINEDGRPVLIDFGSARFDTAEATSTKVTFHTPPYAAIEQYVKTYEQGPWTDIYALGVVLYECVTGEKPPEVLERLHAGLGTPLADGKWLGYSKHFLAAIDSAMTIKPSDRPRSIPEWLNQFGEMEHLEDGNDDDEDATRFYAHEVTADEIVPVPPPAADFSGGEVIETQVPRDPNEAEFKRVGHDTGASRKAKSEAKADLEAAAAAVTPRPLAKEPEKEAPAAPVAAATVPPRTPEGKDKPAAKPGLSRNAMIAGGAVALVAAAVGGWAILGRDSTQNDAGYEAVPDLSGEAASATAEDAGLTAIAAATNDLANDGRVAGMPAAAVDALQAAAQQLSGEAENLKPLLADPAQAAAARTRADEARKLASTSNLAFASALLRDAEGKARRLSADVPWANPDRAGRGASTPQQRSVAARLSAALAALRTTVQGGEAVVDPVQAIGIARDALGKSQAFASAIPAAYSAQAAKTRLAEQDTRATVSPGVAATNTVARSTSSAAAASAEESSSSGGVSSAKMAQFNAAISEGRNMARQVIRLSDKASGQRKANAQLARNYDKYLATLKDSMRGINSNSEADKLIKQAGQTNAYLRFLLKQSNEAPQ